MSTTTFVKDMRTSDSIRNKPCMCGSGKKYKHCHWSVYNCMAGQMTPAAIKATLKDVRYRMMRHWRETGTMLTPEQIREV